jgi:hypothetical protein
MAAWNFSVPRKGILMGECFWGNPGKQGYSIGGQFEVLPSTNIFGRYDAYNIVDTSVSTNDKNFNVVGLEYLWGSNLRLAADVQNDITNGAVVSNVYAFHSEVKW